MKVMHNTIHIDVSMEHQPVVEQLVNELHERLQSLPVLKPIKDDPFFEWDFCRSWTREEDKP